MTRELESVDAGVPAAGERWRHALRALELPPAVSGATEDRPVMLAPDRFRWRPDEDATQPVRALTATSAPGTARGRSVLDAGVRGGASSLGLVPKPGLIVGVDHNPGMLELFLASAEAAGVQARAVTGTWPAVAFARERLRVGPDRDEEIGHFLRNRQPQEQRVVALWRPGAA